MHVLLHSMLPFSSLVLRIPIVKLSIDPSSSSTPYFLWFIVAFFHSFSPSFPFSIFFNSLYAFKTRHNLPAPSSTSTIFIYFSPL
jgi:hypothetical protein